MDLASIVKEEKQKFKEYFGYEAKTVVFYEADRKEAEVLMEEGKFLGLEVSFNTNHILHRNPFVWSPQVDQNIAELRRERLDGID